MILIQLDIRGEEKHKFFIWLHIPIHASKVNRAFNDVKFYDFVSSVDLLVNHHEFILNCLNSVRFEVKIGKRLFLVIFDLRRFCLNIVIVNCAILLDWLLRNLKKFVWWVCLMEVEVKHLLNEILVLWGDFRTLGKDLSAEVPVRRVRGFPVKAVVHHKPICLIHN